MFTEKDCQTAIDLIAEFTTATGGFCERISDLSAWLERAKDQASNVTECITCGDIVPGTFVTARGECFDCKRNRAAIQAAEDDDAGWATMGFDSIHFDQTSGDICRCCGADLSRESHQANCENN